MKKDISISLIRLIATIMIVTCHFMQQLNNELAWWVNVGVQIFFAMSGYLYGKKTIEEPFKWIKQRFFRILLDYYIYIVMIVLFYFIFAKDLLKINEVAVNLFCVQGFVKAMPNITHLWFIPYILICYIITPMLQSIYNYLKKKSDFIFWLIILTITGLVQIYQIYGLMNITVAWLACYVFGYFIAQKYSKEHKQLTKVALFLISICIISNGAQIYFEYIKKLELSTIIILFYQYSHMILGLTLFIVMYKIFSKLKENKILEKVLNFSDTYSYDIYIVHQIYILNTFSLIALTNSFKINLLIIVIAISLNAILLRMISKFISK